MYYTSTGERKKACLYTIYVCAPNLHLLSLIISPGEKRRGPKKQQHSSSPENIVRVTATATST